MENRWVKEGVNQKEMGRAKLSMGNGKWMCRIEDMFVDRQHMATSNIHVAAVKFAMLIHGGNGVISLCAGLYNTALLPVKACRILVYRPKSTKRESLCLSRPNLQLTTSIDRLQLEPNETHTRTHGSRHSTPARIFARNKAERLRPAEMGEKMTVSLAFRGLSRDHHLERDLPNDDT